MKKILLTLIIIFFCCIQTASAQTWWEKYNDPLLVGYINDAIANNPDYRRTLLKVEESRARVREYFGKELPKLSAPLTYLNIKPPPFAANPAAFNEREQLIVVPLLANYELDLRGTNRAATKAQKEQLAADEQDSRAVYIALMTDVALAYFNIVQFDRLIELQNNVILTDMENVNLFKSEYDQGLTQMDDVLAAESTLLQSQTTLNDLLKSRDVYLNELITLTGRASDDSDKSTLARASIDDISLPPDVPLEIPSTGVMNRPDILRAEANLRQAKINVDIARKMFLPKINVFGIVGFQDILIGNIFRRGEFLNAFGSLVSEDLYTGGQRHAVLKERKFQYEQLLENYQTTILTALKETNNALYAFKTDLQTNESNLARLQVHADNLNLANVRYMQGLSSKQEEIEPQRSLLLVTQDQTRTKASYLVDTLNLYKALGGGI
jgi:multidrug efflux system outer membrane protein